MRSFIPKKLLACAILCECLSRTALIFALFQIPTLNSQLSTLNWARLALPLHPYAILNFLIPIFIFAAFHFLSRKLSLKLGSEAKKKIRAYFQNKFLNTPPIQDRAQKGMPLQDLSLHYMKTADLMEPWYSRFLPSAGVAVLVPCIILCIMFFTDKLTFAILFITGMLLPVFLFLIGKVAKQKSEAQWQSFAKLRSFFLESLQGFKTIKIFKKVRERERDLEIAEEEFGKKTFAVLKTAFLSALVQEWAAAISVALVAAGLALRLLNGSVEFGIAFLALLIIPEFYRPIRQFGLAFHVAIDAKTAWNEIEKLRVESGEWRVNNVKRNAFYNANSQLSTLNSQLIYVTGPSGSGKTKMILSQLSTLHSQLKNVAYMPQTPIWFKGTLWENLCPVEHRDFEEVKAALEKVNLGHFVSRLNEQVLEYANNFSGGEKRRLALARVILLNRPIWILDEPFAGLDAENARAIEELLERESLRRNILCVSHHHLNASSSKTHSQTS